MKSAVTSNQTYTPWTKYSQCYYNGLLSYKPNVLQPGLLSISFFVFLFQINLSVVDIDEAIVKIATDWFGFVQDELLTVHVSDGIELVKKEVENGKKKN